MRSVRLVTRMLPKRFPRSDELRRPSWSDRSNVSTLWRGRYASCGRMTCTVGYDVGCVRCAATERTVRTRAAEPGRQQARSCPDREFTFLRTTRQYQPVLRRQHLVIGYNVPPSKGQAPELLTTKPPRGLRSISQLAQPGLELPPTNSF